MQSSNLSQERKQKMFQNEQKTRKKLLQQNIQLFKQIFQLQKQVNEVLTKKQAKKIKNQQLQKQLTYLYGEQIQEQQKKIRRLKEQVYYLKSSNAKMNVEYINKEQSELLLLVKERNQLIREKQLLQNFVQDKKQVLSKNDGLYTHKKNLQNQYNQTKKINQKYSSQIVQLQRQVRKFHLLAKNIKQHSNKKTQNIDTQKIELQIQQNINLIFRTKNQIKEIEDKWKPNVDSLNSQYFSLTAEQKEKRQKIEKLQKEIKVFQYRSKSLRDQSQILNDRNRLAKVTVSSSLGFSQSIQKKKFKDSKFIEQTDKKEKVKNQFILKELENLKAKKFTFSTAQKQIKVNISVNEIIEKDLKSKQNLNVKNQKPQTQKIDEKVALNQTELKKSKQKIVSKNSESKKQKLANIKLQVQKQNQEKSTISKSSEIKETLNLLSKKSFKEKSNKKVQQKNQIFENQTQNFQSLDRNDGNKKKLKLKSKQKQVLQKIENNKQSQLFKKTKDYRSSEKKLNQIKAVKQQSIIYKRQKSSSSTKEQDKIKFKIPKEYQQSNQKSQNKINQQNHNHNQLIKNQKKVKKTRQFQKELKQEIQFKQKEVQKSENTQKFSKESIQKIGSAQIQESKKVSKFQIKLQNKILPKKQQNKSSTHDTPIKKQTQNLSVVKEPIKNQQKSQIIPVNVDKNIQQKAQIKQQQIQQVFKPYLIKRKRPGGSLNFQNSKDNKQKQNILSLIQKKSIGVGNTDTS